MRKAFTMVELVFVIVVIGILAGIAMKKMSATRDDATMTKGKSQVASIRSALTNEAQRRMMEGNYTAIENIGGTVSGMNKPIFDFFDTKNDGTPKFSDPSRVLGYAPYSCSDGTSKSCWIRAADVLDGSGNLDYSVYAYVASGGMGGGTVKFQVKDGRFDCNGIQDGSGAALEQSNKLCKMLDR